MQLGIFDRITAEIICKGVLSEEKMLKLIPGGNK